MKTAASICCLFCFIAVIFSPSILNAEDRLVRSIPVKGGLPPDVLRVTSPGSSGPRLVAYWDAGLTERTACLSTGDTVTAYIVAENMPGPLENIRYTINTSSSVWYTYVSETVETGSATGDAVNGIRIDFSPSADASGQLLLQTIRFLLVDPCSGGCADGNTSGISFYSHPDDGFNDNAFASVEGTGDILVYAHRLQGCDSDGLPNLEIVSFTSPDTAMIYEDISTLLSLQVRNNGADSMINDYYVQLRLVDDNTTTDQGALIRNVFQGPLDEGASAAVDLSDARIPLSQQTGLKYLCLILDMGGTVHELDEADNYLWHPIVIIPDPDIDTTYVYAEDFQEGDGGWTSMDLNQAASYWQTEAEALWCGSDDPSWSTPPGYGNSWEQAIIKQFSLGTAPVLSYMIQYDVEPDYDYVYVQVSTDGISYSTVDQMTGSSGGYVQRDIDLSAYSSSSIWIKFLVSTDSGYSDEDGYYPSDGAARLDWVSVTGYPTDNFTSSFDGWEPDVPGSPGGELRLEYDPACTESTPCDLNVYTGEEQVTCNAWVAYDPETGVFPFGDGGDVNIAIESPVFSLPQDPLDVILKFDVYADLPLGSNVFYDWEVAFDPAWTWTSDMTMNYGTGGWITTGASIAQYIPPGATEMKIRLVAKESQQAQPTYYHSPSPIFDNVVVYGIGPAGQGIDVTSFPRDCILSDQDWDGVGDLADACPAEASDPFDRDGDGCLDEGYGSRHIEYLSLNTLSYYIHEDGAPYIGDGSDFTAIQNGFEAWNAVSGTDIEAVYAGTTSEPVAIADDGINTVTFSDPEFNFPMGVLAVGISTSYVEPTRYQERLVRPGDIIDADIIFNPNMAFETPTSGSGTDIQSVATHEAGHLFGISHSAVRTSTMFFVLPPGTEASTLEVEDQVSFRQAYANEATMASASRLKGAVNDGETGEPVPGAIVYAISAASGDTLGSGYTMEDGTFDFLGLPSGDYYVAIHPLNGSSRIGYLQAANINEYIREIYVDLFVPEYYDAAESNSDDETAMTAVSVSDGLTTNVEMITNIDEDGPAVAESSPSPGDTGVKIDASILISFSESIDFETIQGNFSLRDTVSGQAIGGSAATLDDDSTLAFIPSSNLDFETVYELRLETGLSDKFGNGLTSPWSMLFSTEPKPDVGITSIMPRKGIETAVAVISGYGFEAEASGNVVHFNGADAVITEASPSRLVIEVPEGAQSGNVTVENLVEAKTSNALTFTMLAAEEVARGFEAGLMHLGSNPFALAASPDGGLMFVATADGYSAVVVDPGSADYLTARAFPVQGGLHGIDMTPDGKRVYAISGENGALYRINGERGAGGLDDLQVLSEIALDAQPLGILVEPSGRRAYIATEDGNIDVFDVNPSSATFDRQVGRIPSIGLSLRGGLTLDPSGTLLLVPSGEGKLIVCDTRADTLVTSIPVGLDPRDVTVDPTGTRAYVTDDNGVAVVVSLEMLEKVAEVPTGGSLRGDAVTPAGSFLFSVNRELNFYDVIDLRQTSQTYRSVIANIGLPVNPVDVELSPDGQYAYSICERDMALAVTAIGIGPTIHTVSPVAGPAGAKVVIAGSGFGADSTISVLFNGIAVEPDVRRDGTLVVTVPAGDVTGPLTVVGSNPVGPETVSNEVYFEGLAGIPGDVFRTAGMTAFPGMTGEACVSTVTGDIMLFVAESGTDIAVAALDTDPFSDTYMQSLGTAAMPAGMSADEILTVPSADMALVVDDGAGGPGETGIIPLMDINRFSPDFLTITGSLDVSAMTMGVSGACMDPSGGLLILAEYGDPGSAVDATVHVFERDPELPGGFAPVTSLTVPGTPVVKPVFHPTGLRCYLPVADPEGPALIVLDTDPSSPGFLGVSGSMPLPGSPGGPVPGSAAFTPDGGWLIALTRDAGATELQDAVMIDTSSPDSPVVRDVEPLGGGGAGACNVDVSPLGVRAVASVEGEGLYHIELVTQHDSLHVVGRRITASSITGGSYSVDGSIYYQVIPDEDTFEAADFSAAQTLELVSGGGQSGVAGSLLPARLRVKVSAAGGVGLGGIPVRFSVYEGNGYFLSNQDTVRTVTTDGDGHAGVQWVLGPGTGTQRVRVFSPGLAGSPGTFTAHALTDPETLPLETVEVVPFDSTTGISTTSAVRLTFSRSVDPASVDTTACYLIEKDGAEPVPAILGFSDGNRRVSITPRQSLAPLTEYSVEVTADVLDGEGGPLQEPGSSVFTTADPPPLRIDAVYPPSSIKGMEVVISGQGFDRDAGDNIVYFNGLTAGITEAADDHLTVVVPFDAAGGTNVLQVETGGQVSNALSFRVLAAEINPMDDDVIKKVGTGSSTRSVVVTPDGALMYAVSPATNSVIVVDIISLQPLASVPVGENPFAITLDPRGARAYVTNFLDHTVSVINTERYSGAFNTVEETIEVGLNPIDALVMPDGDRLVVSNLSSMDLSIVDTDISSVTYNMVLRTVGTGQTTRVMTVTPDGGLLYVGTSDGYLVVSAVDFGVVKTVGTGSTTRSITVTPDGALLVLLTAQGEVLFVDIAEGSPTEDQVVGRVGTSSAVRSVTVTPDGGLLYLVLEAFDAILTVQLERLTTAGVIDGVESPLELVQATVIDTVYAGEDPAELAFAPGGADIAVITNAGDNSVSIYNPEGGPIGIAISGFDVKQSSGCAMIDWRTHLEEGVSGFHVLRSDHPDFGYGRLTDSIIWARGLPSDYRYRDGTVTAKQTYYYKLQAVDDLGRSEEFGPVEFVYTPRFALYQNVPNPFNPDTRISFVIPEAGRVDLRIYDVAGRLVKTLVEGRLEAGRYEVNWDGSNNGGRRAASGVYFYRIRTGRHEKTRKMVLLR